MSNPVKPTAADEARPEDDRLAHALVSRGLVTQDEVQQASAGEAFGPEALLKRLVERGMLTVGQARRAWQEIGALLKQQIPGYQLLETLGQGSMGTVHKARQLSMNRLVAIKILSARLAARKEFLERFRREAHVAAKLSHNNIVQAIDVGSAGPLQFFVMEFVAGTTIQQMLAGGKVFAEREAVEIILQIAQALEHAHRRQLIHRDVKPANIILTPEGVAKLADLGVARETSDAVLTRKERGQTIGTPYYMAPEQVRGDATIDGRADLYALGATLYHMVTGRPPFSYPDVDSVLNAHLNEELTPPDHLRQELSGGLGEVVELMMAKQPRDRYATLGDVILDLESLLRGEAPRLARRQIRTDTLAGLSEGEDAEALDGARPTDAPSWYLVYGLIAGLVVSLLLNFLLILRL